jgi:hypothetical protein
MTRIFLSYAPENATCAGALRTGLEAQSYTTWREPPYPNPNSASYPHLIETAVLGSAAVVLIWSQHAAQTAWVERHLLFAQKLKKPIFPLLLDHTSLPTTADYHVVIPWAEVALDEHTAQHIYEDAATYGQDVEKFFPFPFFLLPRGME